METQEINKRYISESLQKHLANFGYKDLNKSLSDFETKIEKDLISLFQTLGITALIKSDKYSLPFTNEVAIKVSCASYINDLFDTSGFKRKLLTELLNKKEKYYKMRFYVYIETYDGDNIFNRFGLTYNFRYYIHEFK